MLNNILDFLTSADGGAFLVISWFAAWALEGIEKWHMLDSRLKWIIILVGSGLLGAGAAILKAYPNTVEMIDPFISPFIYAVLAWLGTQAPHKAEKLIDRLSASNG